MLPERPPIDEEPEMVDSMYGSKESKASPSDSSSDDDDDDDDDEEEDVSVQKKLEDIMRKLKEKQLDLDDNKLESFFKYNGTYIQKKAGSDKDNKTLLHLLVDDAKDKVFEKYEKFILRLIETYPSLLREKDANEKTPLYHAINKRRDRDKFLSLVCENATDIEQLLAIQCYHDENCIHLAIRRKITPALALSLIDYADKEALLAIDDKGRTPLHIAVEYEYCTNSQLDIVRSLIVKCDAALDQRTNETNFSPYRHHEDTCKNHNNTSKGKAKAISASKKDEADASSRNDAGWYDDIDMKPKAAEPQSKSGSRTPSLPPKIQSHRTANSTRHGWNEGQAPNSNPPLPSKKSGKKTKEEEKASPESAQEIGNYLKLYCLRTRFHEDALRILYGPAQEKQIYFDLYELRSPTISEDFITKGLNHLEVEEILQYVALPCAKIIRKPVHTRAHPKTSKPDGNGRTDMLFLFNFLRKEKKVKRIIKVIVDDMTAHAHSDEAIEKALKDFQVEIWDWQKIDICAQVILAAAPGVREVSLYWSGNNAVLRGWSESEGLRMLDKLERVNIHIEQGLESFSRTQSYIGAFCKRLKSHLPGVKIETIYGHRTKSTQITSTLTDSERVQGENRHKWLTCMDDFADFIQNITFPFDLNEQVIVALIDDGIDINEPSLQPRIIDGRSFCRRSETENLGRPYYLTEGGHGSVMASLICRVCPLAKLFVLKLDEQKSEDSTRQITAKSAAKAVNAAVDRKVHIISMSWTIESTPNNRKGIQELDAALERASKAGILMFCAASDQGATRDASFPAACGGTKNIFKIGAAEASGAAWNWVGDSSQIDFFFPGHKVVKERPNDAPIENCSRPLTGSSVATAIATGLATLVLYCVQIGALHMRSLKLPSGHGGNTVTMEDYKAIKMHQAMKESFLKIGTSRACEDKYIEVWNLFGSVAKFSEKDDLEKLGIVTQIALRLKPHNMNS